MLDEDKAKRLLDELVELRRRNAELEALEVERKQAEKALEESEERFRSLMEQSPVSIELYDANGLQIAINVVTDADRGL